MKIRFPFPTSRNNQLRGGSGWSRIENSLQKMAAALNGMDQVIDDAIQTNLNDPSQAYYTDMTSWANAYFTSGGNQQPSPSHITPLDGPIVLHPGDSLTVDPGSLITSFAKYRKTGDTYTRTSTADYTTAHTFKYDEDSYITFSFKKKSGNVTFSDFNGSITGSIYWLANINSNTARITALEQAGPEGSYFYGKKLIACGDSITGAVNPGGGYFDSYAKLTAQRLGMQYYENAVSGSTMTNVEGKNPFSVDRYEDIPEDIDYITIWFGWNDGAYATVGTISDDTDTTFYGAYNKVLTYYLTNMPTVKIGLIVPYMANGDFQTAVRNLSTKYGIPCLDLADGNKCSVLWSQSAPMSARTTAMTYDGTHPNQAGHDFLSTMYEQFIRRL